MTPERLETIISSLNLRQPDLTVIMENVIKPHNLAAVARTLESVGGMEIHAISTARSLKLTQMAAGGVRKWLTLKKHKETNSGLSYLKEHGFKIIATYLSEDAKDYRQADYTCPCAIFVGEELEGISEKALEMADECITIPMVGMVQSLNVSVASAIVLYEAYRQRQAVGMYAERRIDEAVFMKLLFEACHPKVARYCKQKKIPYPKINEQAELLEPVADSLTYSDESFVEWMSKRNL